MSEPKILSAPNLSIPPYSDSNLPQLEQQSQSTSSRSGSLIVSGLKYFSFLLFLIFFVLLSIDLESYHSSLQSPWQKYLHSIILQLRSRLLVDEIPHAKQAYYSMVQSLGSSTLISQFTYYLIAFTIYQVKFLQQVYKEYFRDSSSSRPLVLKNNFANILGGAVILLKDPEAQGINNILAHNNDKYLYTSTRLPIHFVIGLKEEIAVENITIKSREMYSCILQDFKIEGSFTFPDAHWVELGRFKAKDTFEEQTFVVERKVVRYLKFTITSVYGGWKYFTLTQVKVFGDGIFADAKEHLSIAEEDSPTETKEEDKTLFTNDQISNSQNVVVATGKEIEVFGKQKRTPLVCPGDAVSHLLQKQQDTEKIPAQHTNVIVELHKKIKEIQGKNKLAKQNLQELVNRIQQLNNQHEAQVIRQKQRQRQEETRQELMAKYADLQKEVQSLSFFKYVILYGAAMLLVSVMISVLFIYGFSVLTRNSGNKNLSTLQQTMGNNVIVKKNSIGKSNNAGPGTANNKKATSVRLISLK